MFWPCAWTTSTCLFEQFYSNAKPMKLLNRCQSGHWEIKCSICQSKRMHDMTSVVSVHTCHLLSVHVMHVSDFVLRCFTSRVRWVGGNLCYVCTGLSCFSRARRHSSRTLCCRSLACWTPRVPDHSSHCCCHFWLWLWLGRVLHLAFGTDTGVWTLTLDLNTTWIGTNSFLIILCWTHCLA